MFDGSNIYIDKSKARHGANQNEIGQTNKVE